MPQKKNGRTYIGIELSQKYAKLAEKRIMDDIFGYTFDEISLAQQGGRLGRVIDTSKPTLDESATEESDLKLLAQYGERKLRDMGYMGVIDRLERGGHLSSNAALTGLSG